MRSRHTPMQPQPVRLRRQGFDVARHRVVGFVAVHVDQQAALGRDLAQTLHRGRAIGHGPFEMRNAADHFDAAVQRADQIRLGGRRAEQAVLGKRDQLQFEIRRHAPLDLEQGIHREQAVVANVHMATNRQKPLGDGHIAIGHGAGDHRVLGQVGLELAP